uniref:Fumarylacetoacetate hydrolase domain-containing protein 2B n=1 Tax=Sus scrofa TaxID=9823 RepID=A0A480GU82_PIG
MMTPSSSVSHWTSSPFLRKRGGFLNTPTPAGVPVRMMSPGQTVTNRETQAISSSVLNTIWLVLLLWTTSPFPWQQIFKLGGSATVLGHQGRARGKKVSKVFPSSHCFPLHVICQSQALTSCATVKPATWAMVSVALMCLPFFPMITASSTSQSTSWLSGGSTISS